MEENDILRQIFKDQLEGKKSVSWTEENVREIIDEAVRLLKKDDSFWESIEHSLDQAIENVAPEEEYDDEEDDE